MPDIVLLAVFPAIAPGFMVQFPAGKPFNTTLPVATAQVGCVIGPIVGAAGVIGCAFITTFPEPGDVQPTEFVTVKEYVPATNPEIVLLAVFPANAPGLMVQFPAGKPFNTKLPVATEQVGCVIVDTVGADGVTGCGVITKFADGNETHPEPFVTV